MAAAARRGGSQKRAQPPRIGKRNQAWILVKSASAQTAPAPAIATSGRLDRIDRSPTRRARVQNKLKNVSRADERGKQKRVRRAFTDDEMRKLVAGSEDRGIIYFTAARTGLRQEELKQMKWGDLRLDAAVPFVVVRDYAAKNKKEESVQLVPEIVEALAAHRPIECKGTDLVFPSGIPRARRLTKDAEANGIGDG